jgi:biotin carboxyl carrier protein
VTEVANDFAAALVLGVLVDDGDHVAAGQPLVMLESMKLLHDIVAPRAGIVRLRVKVGDEVNHGDVVAMIE